MLIKGKHEKVQGDWSGNMIPMIFCPAAKALLSVNNCRLGCCSHGGKIKIDDHTRECWTDCRFAETENKV